MSYNPLIKAIQAVLTTDLLKKEYRIANAPPFYGHCYIASEALWHLTGKQLDVYNAKDENGVVHWWLQDGIRIVDPTLAQYAGRSPPYAKGRRAAFLSNGKMHGRPSKRAQAVINRLTNGF
jgi:hypothetical protein